MHQPRTTQPHRGQRKYRHNLLISMLADCVSNSLTTKSSPKVSVVHNPFASSGFQETRILVVLPSVQCHMPQIAYWYNIAALTARRNGGQLAVSPTSRSTNGGGSPPSPKAIPNQYQQPSDCDSRMAGSLHILGCFANGRTGRALGFGPELEIEVASEWLHLIARRHAVLRQ